jgi:hypothetical protein
MPISQPPNHARLSVDGLKGLQCHLERRFDVLTDTGRVDAIA